MLFYDLKIPPYIYLPFFIPIYFNLYSNKNLNTKSQFSQPPSQNKVSHKNELSKICFNSSRL